MESLVKSTFWRGKRVLVTGHTGFKGAWLSFILTELGANVSGISLPPKDLHNLFNILNIQSNGDFTLADINDENNIKKIVQKNQPEIILHLAAQALVRESYQSPLDTFTTNVIGTLNLLNAVRECRETRSVVIVTSDKVYENMSWPWGYRETDSLGGHDPYSASKACAEIVTSSMRRSFFGSGMHPARIATVRAGNVIGGGDWSENRLVPDIVRGCLDSKQLIKIRNPNSVRPWQHVLDPISAYLMIAEKLYDRVEGVDNAWNIGPMFENHRTVQNIAESIVNGLGKGKIEIESDANALHEAKLLMLDCSKIQSQLGWFPKLDYQASIDFTVNWYREWVQEKDMKSVTRDQLETYMHI